MRPPQKIWCFLITFCALQWSFWMVESATTGVDTSKTAYVGSDDKGQEVTSDVLESIYHKSRQSRCVTCYDSRKYGDNRSSYYGSYAARSGGDRFNSWYYPKYDRYEERGYRSGKYDKYGYGADPYSVDRYGSDRYVSDRYGADRYSTPDRYAGYRDDRYGARLPYDRYDTRMRIYDRPRSYERGESRGYGYDNRDRYYSGERGGIDYYGRDRYYDRPRYSTGGGANAVDEYDYGRGYYYHPPRYDYRPYRPWEKPYSGRSDFDSSSRGHYYSKGKPEDRRYLTEPDYSSPAVPPLCNVRRPGCSYNPQDGGTRVTSGPIASGYHYMGISNSNTDNSKSSGSGWSYLTEDEQPPRVGNSGGSHTSNNNNNNADSNKDQQSFIYGALLDRGSNLIAVEPDESNENATDSTTNKDHQPTNGDEKPKQTDNGQKS